MSFLCIILHVVRAVNKIKKHIVDSKTVFMRQINPFLAYICILNL